jgi:hypothetical protein
VDPQVSTIVLLAAISTVAALLRIKGGFGYSLIIFPIVSWFFTAQAALTSCIVLELLIGLYTLVVGAAFAIRIELDLLWMAACALISALLFKLLLVKFPFFPTYSVGISIASLGGLLLIFPQVRLRPTFVRKVFASIISGCLGVACGIAGPPMLLVMFGDNVREWTRIRSRLTGYFFIVYLGLLFIENQLIRDTVTNSESPIVALVVGAIFGIVISHKIELSMNADVWSRVGGYIVLAACIASITSKL